MHALERDYTHDNIKCGGYCAKFSLVLWVREMKIILSFSILLALISQPGSVLSEVVSCNEQKEVCKCSPGERECEFLSLTIDELQTFASYEINNENDDLLVKGAAADTYYMNSEGFSPSVPNINIPERGNRCYFENERLVHGEDFTRLNCSIPMTVDGVSYRSFVAINGRIPGPTLIVDEGSLVRVRVVNRLTSEGITIHWHGMHQRGTPWMDGVGFISQAPIGPGAVFDYIFNATPAGTHWYHSHVGAQRTDGLFGALIVREKSISFENDVTPQILNNPPAAYSVINDMPSLHTLTLLDWQREASLDLFIIINSALGFYNREKAVHEVPTNEDVGNLYVNRTRSLDNIEVGPVPYWSGLINGRGVYDISDTSTYFNLSLFNVGTDDNVGYRFRVVGAQSLYAYNLSIDDHKLRVIATDGHFIQPVLVDFLIVHSGERYDFIPERMQSQTMRRKYWIRAETVEDRQQVHLNFDSRLEHSARAVLIYGDLTAEDKDWTRGYSDVIASPRDCTADTPCQILNCPFENYPEGAGKTCISLTDLSALQLENEEDPPIFDTAETLFFNFGFEGSSATSAINGRNFKFPATPYQTYCGQYDRDKKDNLPNTCEQCTGTRPKKCTCTNVVRIARNKDFSTRPHGTVMMVFSAVGFGNNFEFSHPIHLHGHSFYVLHIGYGTYGSNGHLLSTSTDVSCGDPLCMQPTWRDQMVPDEVLQENVNGRINSSRIRKDTVILPAGGYVVVAFEADNPGYWFLHCHIEVHQLEGMGILVEEYSYEHHREPPDGINRHGNFIWSVQDFEAFVNQEKTCSMSGGGVSLTSNTFFIFALIFFTLMVSTVCDNLC